MRPDYQSEWRVEVVQIGAIEKHPNADTLSITQVDGYPCIFRTGEFVPGDKAVYISVDSVVPLDNPLFSFLPKGRIRAIRLRGIFSMGLLVKPSNPAWEVGRDVSDELEIVKYETKDEKVEKLTAQNRKLRAYRDPGLMPKYDLAPLRKYGHILEPGEEVAITEKIHGTNARYLFHNGKLYVGSHRVFRGNTRARFFELIDRLGLRVKRSLGMRSRTDLFEEHGDVWWQTAMDYNIKERLSRLPDLVLYGEIYGKGVQDLTYNSPDARRLVVFDIFDIRSGKFFDKNDFEAAANRLALETVPVLYMGPWDPQLSYMANGPSKLAGGLHIREGMVVKPVKERYHPHLGRVAFKLAGENYLLRKEKEEQ